MLRHIDMFLSRLRSDQKFKKKQHVRDSVCNVYLFFHFFFLNLFFPAMRKEEEAERR